VVITFRNKGNELLTQVVVSAMLTWMGCTTVTVTVSLFLQMELVIPEVTTYMVVVSGVAVVTLQLVHPSDVKGEPPGSTVQVKLPPPTACRWAEAPRQIEVSFKIVVAGHIKIGIVNV
jgi:hypothetical protein